MEITTIGLDLAKRVFQVLPFFAKLPPCLIGMEACGTSHTGRASCLGWGIR